MIDWLLDVLGLGPSEPPVEDEIGYILIVDG